ncbi:MAG: Dabb family protein [Planctomycetota bacterium]|nr:MAG: Dabb family protein [Planctomycetota bacterium]
MQPQAAEKQEKVLRHVVLFKFKETSSAEDIQRVVDAFRALPAKIPQIADFEYGTNNSPEGLDRGFTHCFLLTFRSEEDRAAYLPHPDHRAFGQILRPHLADEGVLVIDYWAQK